mmetsp:Transcript_51104/g.143656  ORF Transcript_51104/g.143656 Transcript_51104/m.143656 type:complete len:270 (-) Transcript_51104:646-1455(-)
MGGDVAVGRLDEEAHRRQPDRLHHRLRADHGGVHLLLLLTVAQRTVRRVPESGEVALAEHVVVLGDDIRVPTVYLGVRCQGEGHRVGGVRERRPEFLVREACHLEDRRRVGGRLRHHRHRQDISHQEHWRLPDRPHSLLGGHHEPLVRQGAEVVRVPQGVRVANGDEHTREVTLHEDRANMTQSLAVRPLRVRGLAGHLGGQVLRVIRREDVGEEVLCTRDEPVGLFATLRPLSRFHGEHDASPASGHRRAAEILEGLLQHGLALLVVR